MTLKTFFIYNRFDDGLKFGSVDYDVSHLNDKYLNSAEIDEGESDELTELSAKATWYPSIHHWALEIRRLTLEQETQFRFIECGFIP